MPAAVWIAIAFAAWLALDALFVGALVALRQRRERRFRATADALVEAAERYANGVPPAIWRSGSAV